MDEDKTSSEGCGPQEVRPQTDTLTDIHNQILQLLSTRLSDDSVKVMQQELLLMQRGSYYLEIQCEDPMYLSDNTAWSLIDQQRLCGAVKVAKTQVKLLLTYLEILHQEIMRDCRELEAFVVTYDQGLVDSHMAASMQQRLQQTHQDLKEFERRLTQTLGPLNLQSLLSRNARNLLIPEPSAKLVIKMPVIFDRFRSGVTSTSAYLCWEVAGQQPDEPNEQFELCLKSLHPTAVDHGQMIKYVCQSYHIHVNDLISDRYYEFSVKRVDATNLVYGMWIDTITLKTMNISEQETLQSEEGEEKPQPQFSP